MPADKYKSRKYLPPILPAKCTPRPELRKLYNQAQAGRFIFVSAPPGYGKTVSTQMWLSETGFCPIWIRLDQYDNPTAAFYKLLGYGLLSVQPQNEAIRNVIDDPIFNISPIEQAMNVLSEFRPDGREYVLVLDDFHNITNREVIDSFLLVCRRLPASFILAVLSRERQDDVFYDEINNMGGIQITAEELAFSAAEIRDYCSLSGLEASAREINELQQLTKGWAMGVFALSGLTAGRRKSGLRLLEDYFKNQVWRGCDEKIRQLILAIAVSDELSLELCRLLADRADADQLLDALYRKYFFLSKTADGTFYFHDLVLQIIRNLPEYKTSDTSRSYAVMAEHYYRQNDLSKARHFAVMSKDMETIAKYGFPSIHKCVQAFEDQKIYISDLRIDSISEESCRNFPYLYIIKVWYYLMESSADRFLYYLDKMYESAPKVVAEFPRFAYMYHRFFAADHRRPFPEICDWSTQNLSLSAATREDMENIVTYTFQLPFVHRSSRDFHELADPGLIEKYISLMQQSFDADNTPFFSALHSGLLLELNQGRPALESALMAVSRLSRLTLHEVRFSTYMHLAAAYEALGLEGDFAQTMREVEEYINQEARFLYPNYSAFKFRVLMQQGNRSAAQTWLEQPFVTRAQKIKIYEIFQHFTTIRAYILLGRFNDARILLTLLRQYVGSFNRFLDIAETAVLESILAWACGDKSESVSIAEGVIRQLAPWNFMWTIAGEGASVLPILKAVMRKNEKNGPEEQIDKQYLSEVHIAAYARAKTHRGIMYGLSTDHVRKLSKQQKHILTLRSRGLKNSEIAGVTGLTINTIKAHIREAYAKLDVSNLTDAIIKARKLGSL